MAGNGYHAVGGASCQCGVCVYWQRMSGEYLNCKRGEPSRLPVRRSAALSYLRRALFVRSRRRVRQTGCPYRVHAGEAQTHDRIYEKMMEFRAAYREAVATSRRCRSRREWISLRSTGKYVPQFLQRTGAADLVCDYWHHEYQGGGSAAALRTAHSGVDCGRYRSLPRSSGKILGTYTELGDSLLENLRGLVTLKIYQADGRYAKMDEEAKSSRKVTMRAHHAVEFDQRDGSVAYGGRRSSS